jgi:splicing factor 3A subunit 2
MAYEGRVGSKMGGGGIASHSATNQDRRERLRKLALETIDLDKDPYLYVPSPSSLSPIAAY